MIGPKARERKLEEDANESSKKKLNTEKVSGNGGNCQAESTPGPSTHTGIGECTPTDRYGNYDPKTR